MMKDLSRQQITKPIADLPKKRSTKKKKKKVKGNNTAPATEVANKAVALSFEPDTVEASSSPAEVVPVTAISEKVDSHLAFSDSSRNTNIFQDDVRLAESKSRKPSPTVENPSKITTNREKAMHKPKPKNKNKSDEACKADITMHPPKTKNSRRNSADLTIHSDDVVTDIYPVKSKGKTTSAAKDESEASAETTDIEDVLDEITTESIHPRSCTTMSKSRKKFKYGRTASKVRKEMNKNTSKPNSCSCVHASIKELKKSKSPCKQSYANFSCDKVSTKPRNRTISGSAKNNPLKNDNQSRDTSKSKVASTPKDGKYSSAPKMRDSSKAVENVKNSKAATVSVCRHPKPHSNLLSSSISGKSKSNVSSVIVESTNSCGSSISSNSLSSKAKPEEMKTVSSEAPNSEVIKAQESFEDLSFTATSLSKLEGSKMEQKLDSEARNGETKGKKINSEAPNTKKNLLHQVSRVKCIRSGPPSKAKPIKADVSKSHFEPHEPKSQEETCLSKKSGKNKHATMKASAKNRKGKSITDSLGSEAGAKTSSIVSKIGNATSSIKKVKGKAFASSSSKNKVSPPSCVPAYTLDSERTTITNTPSTPPGSTIIKVTPSIRSSSQKMKCKNGKDKTQIHVQVYGGKLKNGGQPFSMHFGL